MKALVATTPALLLVDLDTSRIQPVERDRPGYFGISWFPADCELVLSHSGIDDVAMQAIESQTLSERGWLSHGNRRTQVFLSFPHQILCASDGRVICTNTGRNAITVVDLQKPGTFQEQRLSEARWDRLPPDKLIGDHFNSVFEKNGKLFVVAHRFNRGSCIAEFSYPELDLITIHSAGNRAGLHNVWVTSEGEMITCHSEAGALVDLRANRELWRAGAPVYTRGLAASDRLVLVGESEKLPRRNRENSLSGLWLIDRDTWETRDYLSLGQYGDVHEVRLLDQIDYAHHEAPFNGCATLIQSDLLQTHRKSRLDGAAQAQKARAILDGFPIVFGNPGLTNDRWLRASEKDVSLVLAAASGNSRGISFDYDLSHTSSSPQHVGPVIGYRGSGGDTDMLALLLQPNGSQAVASIWEHDGKAWRQDKDSILRGLPLRARLSVVRAPSYIELLVDGSNQTQFRAESSGLGGSLGCRWLNSSVRNFQLIP